MDRVRNLALGAAFRTLRFRRPPLIGPDTERDAAFDALFERALAEPPVAAIEYRLPYPKHAFLSYLVQSREVLLHGSDDPTIERLEPSTTTDSQGRPIEAVFAASDGLWPLFFAILDHDCGPYALRNARCSLPDGSGDYRKFYFFALDRDSLARDPWTDGSVYILPRRTFERSAQRGVIRDEWVSKETVVPCGRLPITRGDFPFFEDIVPFRKGEPLPATWLRVMLRGG